ncbi:hypothetical protein BH09VER1_BH09VER1_17290 [soil metagenome]
MDSVRVLSEKWLNEDALGELLGALASSPQLVDEIVFFTSYYHCAQRLEELRPRVERVSKIFPIVRAAGYRVGINAIATTGHHDENLELAASQSLRRQVGIDGKVCRGALCPADSNVHEYVQELYECLARSQPDFIWVDDDVRLSGHLPTYGCCLCDSCISSFGREVGEGFSHATLVAAFDDDDFARRSRIRRLFMERNLRVICGLLGLIEKAVHHISPTTELGMMTGDRFWEGYGFEQWAKALQGETGLPVRWRPGGGFYADERPREMVDKAHAMGRQVADLPPYVTIIQSEIENFPYQHLRKAAQVNVLEMTAYLFAGCTGSALNVLGQEGNSTLENTFLLERLKQTVPFWEILKKALIDTVPIGVWAAWDPLQIAVGRSGQFKSFAEFFADSERDMNGPYSLSELGIPICYRESEGCLTAISGRMPHALGAKRMRGLLAKGVLLDAEALEALHEMGLGDLTGAKLGKSYEADTLEEFSDHPLNGEYANWRRDCRQSFSYWNEPARELVPTTSETSVLASIKDYQGRIRGASLTVFENHLGGRVSVMSYFPWKLNQSHARVGQLTILCDWLSRNTMPLIIETPSRVVSWARRRADGRMVFGLLNLSGDTYEVVDISVRAKRPQFARLSMDGSTRPVLAREIGKHLHLSINNFKPYTFEVLLGGEAI